MWVCYLSDYYLDSAKERHTHKKLQLVLSFNNSDKPVSTSTIFTCLTEVLALSDIGTEIFTSSFSSHALISKVKIFCISILEILNIL